MRHLFAKEFNLYKKAAVEEAKAKKVEVVEKKVEAKKAIVAGKLEKVEAKKTGHGHSFGHGHGFGHGGLQLSQADLWALYLSQNGLGHGNSEHGHGIRNGEDQQEERKDEQNEEEESSAKPVTRSRFGFGALARTVQAIFLNEQ